MRELKFFDAHTLKMALKLSLWAVCLILFVCLFMDDLEIIDCNCCSSDCSDDDDDIVMRGMPTSGPDLLGNIAPPQLVQNILDEDVSCYQQQQINQEDDEKKIELIEEDDEEDDDVPLGSIWRTNADTHTKTKQKSGAQQGAIDAAELGENENNKNKKGGGLEIDAAEFGENENNKNKRGGGLEIDDAESGENENDKEEEANDDALTKASDRIRRSSYLKRRAPMRSFAVTPASKFGAKHQKYRRKTQGLQPLKNCLDNDDKWQAALDLWWVQGSHSYANNLRAVFGNPRYKLSTYKRYISQGYVVYFFYLFSTA